MSVLPFDKRDGFIWMNGTMLPWADAKLHVLSHGLHYASSVFEGERAYGGRVFKSREHSEIP
jgi:branched-chain amino acid aminotransferase